MSTGSTDVAERIARALSALRLDVLIVIVAAAFVISDAAPGRDAKNDTQHSAAQSQRVREHSAFAMPCTHGRTELITVYDDNQRFAPWAEYRAEGGVR